MLKLTINPHFKAQYPPGGSCLCQLFFPDEFACLFITQTYFVTVTFDQAWYRKGIISNLPSSPELQTRSFHSRPFSLCPSPYQWKNPYTSYLLCLPPLLLNISACLPLYCLPSFSPPSFFSRADDQTAGFTKTDMIIWSILPRCLMRKIKTSGFMCTAVGLNWYLLGSAPGLIRSLNFISEKVWLFVDIWCSWHKYDWNIVVLRNGPEYKSLFVPISVEYITIPISYNSCLSEPWR